MIEHPKGGPLGEADRHDLCQKLSVIYLWVGVFKQLRSIAKGNHACWAIEIGDVFLGVHRLALSFWAAGITSMRASSASLNLARVAVR